MPITIFNSAPTPRLGKNPILYEYTASATWIKPSDPEFKGVFVGCIGGGGGGGSGARKASNVLRSGGGGGAGGSFAQYFIPASKLNSTHSITIGAGGNGGSAISTNTTDGQTGSKGGDTIFEIYMIGAGGGGGGGGSAGAVGGTAGASIISGSTNHHGCISGMDGTGVSSTLANASSPTQGFSDYRAFASGAGGGGFRSTGATGSRGRGGSLRAIETPLQTNANIANDPGADGTNGTISDLMINFFPITINLGSGGSGGAGSNNSGNAGNGGNGGIAAGGGGGGGATDSLGNSGAGGSGGRGACVVIEIYGRG